MKREMGGFLVSAYRIRQWMDNIIKHHKSLLAGIVPALKIQMGALIAMNDVPARAPSCVPLPTEML